jgi:multiple antibiotic resistance protein
MSEFGIAFVQLFVAVDALGVLPMFMNLTDCLESQEHLKKIIIQSAMTALAVALAFIALGKVVLGMLGITVADFMIAGGVLLFVISLNDMLTFEKKQVQTEPESLGAVPIGVPLIVGPAVLTTSLLLVNQYGFWITISAAAVNILIAGFVFSLSRPINRLMGKSGAKTISKLASLILASIAVMMVRKGIAIFLTAGFSPKI